MNVTLNAKKPLTESSAIENFDDVKNTFIVYNSHLGVKGELRCFAEKLYFALFWIYTSQKVRQV